MRKENFGHGYVLDPCCGGKSFYFDKEAAENVVDFIDKRRGTFTYGDRKVTVDPDEVGDFTNLNDTSVLSVRIQSCGIRPAASYASRERIIPSRKVWRTSA